MTSQSSCQMAATKAEKTPKGGPEAFGDILILGAGVYQCGLIRRAKKMGLVAHVASAPGVFPGIELADHFYPVDTTDISEIVRLAERLKVRGVITAGTDVAIPALGAVVDRLGLNGPSRFVAETISYKDRFRAFQHEHGLRAPRYTVASSPEDLARVAGRVVAPLIVKPVDSSGSRGVQIVESVERHAIEKAYFEAVVHSNSSRVCFEEKLEGVEVGGNALLVDGFIFFIAISQKFMEGFVVRGHAYPTSLSDEQQAKVRAEIEKTCRALGYRTGALNFDVMVGADDVAIIELGARLGGNGLTEMVPEAYSYDIQADVLRLTIGMPPVGAPASVADPCGSYVFGASMRGTLMRMPSTEQISEAVPSVFRVMPAAKAGDLVYPFKDNSRQLGCALFRLGEFSWRQVTNKLQSKLDASVAVA